MWRLIRIAWVLARWDVLFLFKARGFIPSITFIASLVPRKKGLGLPGERLAGALLTFGPSFVKLGQVLSTRRDMIGAELASELSVLQDRLPGFSSEEARAVIESEFDKPLGSLFSTFDDEPVASASIAQVHYATIDDGAPVAVKVRRPGVVVAFENDIEFFYWLAELAERAVPHWRRLRLVDLVEAFSESVAVEMDMRLEASAASELRHNFRDDPGFRVPEVDWTRTSRRVLTLEWITGTSIDEEDTLIEDGHNLHDLLEKTVSALFYQVFRDGFFHADLHPGNLLVDPDGNIVAIDFGIMGRLDKSTRRYLADILFAFLSGDYDKVADIHYEAEYVPRNMRRAPFVQSLRALGEPILAKPFKEISIAHFLEGLFQTTASFEMQTQPELLLLQKSMFMAEGLTQRLTPDQNMWIVVRPLMERWARENYGPEAQVKNTVSEAVKITTQLPRLFNRATRVLESLEDSLATTTPHIRPRLGRQRAPSTMNLLLTLASDLLPGLTKEIKQISMLHILLTMIAFLLAGLLIVQFI